MKNLVRGWIKTPGETGQGLISALRALADNAFPEEVKASPSRKEDDGAVRKLSGAHDISNTNPASTFVLIKISSEDVFSYINAFPH